MLQIEGQELPVDLLTKGRQALATGAWEDARACFEAALADEESPEALEGLSWAVWWLNDATTLFEVRERAYQLYLKKGERAQAARMAIWLSSDHMDFRAETAIANGWRQRARRLLEGLDPAPEHGWLALLEGDVALLLNGDTLTAKQSAQAAVRLGRQLGVSDLEVIGLAMEGIALVSEGDLIQGMARLDEATTAALGGELQEISSVTWTLCYLIYACEKVRDYERAAQWCQKMKQFAERYRFHFAVGVCRAHYAGVLIWHAKWDEAELELHHATEDLAASRPPYVAEGTVRLAELRRRQGRLEESRQLFMQAEWHPLASLGLTELALEQGNPQEGQDILRRLLRHIPPENKAERLAALELLIRVDAALGNHENASETLKEAQSLAEAINTKPVRAAVSFSAGMAAFARGDYQEARSCLEDAVHLFEQNGALYEAGRARRELANVLHSLGRSVAAKKEVGLALRDLQKIGALAEMERAGELQRRLVAASSKTGVDDSTGLTRRELDILQLIAQGLTDREIAAAFTISEHTVHRHIANILSKLSLSSRAAAVAYAVRRGLV